jgi:thioredoxin reductase
MTYDVLVVGGGPAGLSAALVLGRCRRSVLLCDEGRPRNAVSRGLHGFLSRDGVEPRELLRISREQLRAYPTVELRPARVEETRRQEEVFAAVLADGARVEARMLLLAVGRRDDLPDLPGLRELWGRSVLHCRYCDGWEVRDRPLAVVTDPRTDGGGDAQLAIQLTQLSDDVVWCTNGRLQVDEPTRRRLDARSVRIREEPVACLEGRGDALARIVFTDGEPLPRQAAFLDPPKLQDNHLAAQLGCTVGDDGCVQVDDRQRTTAPGVFAAGDSARRPARPITGAQVVMAAADGATAAVAIDLELFDP